MIGPERPKSVHFPAEVIETSKLCVVFISMYWVFFTLSENENDVSNCSIPPFSSELILL